MYFRLSPCKVDRQVLYLILTSYLMDVIDAEGGKRFLNGKLRGGFIASGLILVHPTS